MEKKQNVEKHGDAELATFYEIEINLQRKEMKQAISKCSYASSSSLDSDN